MDQLKNQDPDKITPRMRECIDLCHRCFVSCTETARHCLTLGGEHAAKDHLALLLSCAEICHASARVMTMGSPVHDRFCAACTEVCDACADSCERLPDDLMLDCASVCRACADSCRELSLSRTPGRQAA